MINIRKLEAELWESADLLRQGSKLTSSQYCMPVLALLFLRYAYSRYKMVEYNAQLCLMNMAVHGLNGRIISGDEANSFYHDAHNLAGKCDYVMANPPFNVELLADPWGLRWRS